MYNDPLTSLSSLPDTSADLNAAGIRRLWLIPSAQLAIQVLPDTGLPDLYIDVRALLLSDGANFIDVPVLIDYASYSENQASDRNGDYYVYQIQLVVPKDQATVAAWVHRHRDVRWIAVVQDRNSTSRIIGTGDQPLALSVAGGSGIKTGRNGRTLSFTTATPDPAPYLLPEDYELLSLYAAYRAGETILL